jgi:hypothetical protein
MKGLAVAVLVLGLIVLAGAAAALFMIFSPSVTVMPTTILTGVVEGIILLALCNLGLATVALMQCRGPKATAHQAPSTPPAGPPEFRAQ